MALWGSGVGVKYANKANSLVDALSSTLQVGERGREGRPSTKAGARSPLLTEQGLQTLR